MCKSYIVKYDVKAANYKRPQITYDLIESLICEGYREKRTYEVIINNCDMSDVNSDELKRAIHEIRISLLRIAAEMEKEEKRLLKEE